MKNIHYIKAIPRPKKIFYLIMIAFGCMFYTIVIANHYYFRTHAYDYAVYNFAFWDYAHFHINPVPCYNIFQRGNIIFLQDHFSLTLIFLIPVYWLLNWLAGSYTLLIFEVTMILVSGWATYRLIRLRTNDGWLAVISVLYYFLLQGHYSSFGSDYHDLTLICCFIPIFLLCFELRKYAISTILFILLLFSREDISLWFIFIFIVLIIWHWKEREIVGYCIGGIIVSITYFILVFKVFIPLVDTAQIKYNMFQYSALGETPWQAFLYCLKHPIDTFKLLYENQLPEHAFDGVKREFYLVYLISGGFLLFLRPQYFIWFIPLIAQKMFNDDPVRWGILGYYADQVVTILPISVFMTISFFKVKWIRYSLSIIICVLTLSVTWNKMDQHNRAIQWETTIKGNIFDPKFFHPDYDAVKIHADLKLIPPDAKVCASSSILPHVSQRMHAYEFPDVEDADYIAVFTFKDFFILSEKEYSDDLKKYLFNSSWTVIANDPPFLLFKKYTP